MNGRFLFLPLILVIVPLGKTDLHIEHPLGLLGHPLLLESVQAGPYT